jgi:hypothetical protein
MSISYQLDLLEDSCPLSCDFNVNNMEPLLAFIKHQSSVLERSQNTTETDESANESLITLESTVNWNINELGASMGGHGECRTDGRRRISFKTKYNIGVEANRYANQVIGIFIQSDQDRSAPSSQLNGIHPPSITQNETTNTTPPPSSNLPEPERRLRYRILPDWQTSYLWYDPLWPGNPMDTSVIEEEEIEERYPVLYPFFSHWVNSREIGFDQEFGQVNNDAEAITGRSEIVAWEINGFLMGCWMALQDDVDSVVFEPSEKYEIRRDTMESELERFLRDKEIELQSDD